jgi:tricorn protease
MRELRLTAFVAPRNGHDAQLDKAIEVVMLELKEHPLPEFKRPAYPNYHEKDGLGAK